MLSNTADRKPNPSELCHEGSGNAFTGISEAAATKATRNEAPLSAGRATAQSGLATKAVRIKAAHTAKPSHGAVSSPSVRAFAVMFVAPAAARTNITIQTRGHCSGRSGSVLAGVG